MSIKQLRIVTWSIVVVAAACGGKSGEANEPAPGTTRVQINKDKNRTTPITTGEHASTAKIAQDLGCEVKLTAEQYIESMACTFDGAAYKFSFEMSGDQSNQTIWCETAEANAASCEAMAFDKILDPKPVTAPTAPDSAPAS